MRGANAGRRNARQIQGRRIETVRHAPMVGLAEVGQ